MRSACISSTSAPSPAPPRGRATPGCKATVSAAQGDSFERKGDAFAPRGDALGRKVTLLAGSGAGACGRCQHPLLRGFLAALLLAGLAAPLAAQGGSRESLGVFGDWGAFRDPQTPRCYAIAEPERTGGPGRPFASVGTWPREGVRGQVHVRLSRQAADGAAITLTVGGQSFALTGGGGDAWARDRTMDAAIVAAMRSASAMSVSARDRAGRRFTDRYGLAGAATALDAATVGCARIR